jgi:hypothetical protein
MAFRIARRQPPLDDLFPERRGPSDSVDDIDSTSGKDLNLAISHSSVNGMNS